MSDLISWTTFGLWLTWWIVPVVMGNLYPGTYQRYVLASILRAVRYPSLSFCLAVALLWEMSSGARIGVASLDLAAWIITDRRWVRLGFYDEDSWFTGRGKKIKRWLTSHLKIQVPSLTGAGR